MFKFIKLSLFLILFLSYSQLALACESCFISRLGKDSAVKSQDGKWFFEYLFEQKNYDKMDASDAHTLHHHGYEVHDKTTEDFHHFVLGANVTTDLTVSLEMPYVIRRSIQIDSHAALGQKQRSEGLGDMTLLGNYRFWKSGEQSLGGALGVKFPTGYTGEKDLLGEKFEPEFQPGSGSFDYIIGGVYKNSFDRLNLLGNLSYVINTEGAYHFQYGNMLTASVAADYLLNPKWNQFQSRFGLDVVYENEWREKQNGVINPDSGGVTILTGPVVSMQLCPQASVFASLLFPAYQQLGGVHQELDYLWTMGAKINW